MPTPNRKLRVFLCHASQDKPIVRDLYQRLLAEGWIDPWLDEEKLLPGQDWDMEIEKVVEDADVVIVLLSSKSITKKGYVQKEIKVALNIALCNPEGTIFIIPLRLDDCSIPWSIKSIHYIDYFPLNQAELAYTRLLESLAFRAKRLNINVVEIKESLLREAEEKTRKDKEELIRKEVKEKIRNEEEMIIRKREEERARIELAELVRKDTDRKRRLGEKYTKALFPLLIIPIACLFLSWISMQVYSYFNPILIETATKFATQDVKNPFTNPSLEVTSVIATDATKTQTSMPLSTYTKSAVLINDDFNGTSLNTSVWYFAGSSSNNSYTLSDGKLTIYSGITDGGGGTIYSKETYTITNSLLRFETRALVNREGGGGASWGLKNSSGFGGIILLGSNYPANEGLITMMRREGNGGALSFNIPGINGWDWHNYVIDIYNDKVVFYVDNKIVYTEKNEIPVGDTGLSICLDRRSVGENIWVIFDYVKLTRLTP